MAVEMKRRQFTVDEYHRMGDAGILGSDERVELIDGDIVVMSPIGAPHHRCVMFLNEVFVRRLHGRAVLSPQGPLRLGQWSEPQPDIILLRPPLDRYAKFTARVGDALLVVEVADTSLATDHHVKLPRYAAAGVLEVWIVDLNGGAVNVHREPSSEGYRVSRRLERGAEVAPEAFPDVSIEVDDILG